MNITRLIEAYLDGSLEKEEAEELKALAEKDFEFAELIRLHKEINESIRDDELYNLRQLLQKIASDKEAIKTGVVFPLRRMMRIAAVFLFILIAGTVVIKWFFPGYSRSIIFEKYYVKYEPDVITRSGNMLISGLENAQYLYQTGNYRECAGILDYMVRKDNQNYLAWFYLGLTRIELQEPNEAISDFLKIPPNWESPYSIHRNWYLALCLIKTGQEKRARPLLKRLYTSEPFYSQDASKILDKIRF